MNNRHIKKIGRRMARVEWKCDRILAELALLRGAISPRQDELDEVIDRMHRTAQEMRRQSIKERMDMEKSVGW